MYEFIIHRDTEEFLSIEYNMDLISFNNGVLNLKTMEFILNENIDKDCNDISRHHIHSDLDINNLNTEIFDDAVLYQLNNDREILKYFYIHIGRLFFPVKTDDLDCIMFIRGLRSTFKSTILFIIKCMFRKGSVGTINSTHELVFGYEELINKEVILAPDLPINLSLYIKDDMLKGMADGGDVTIPRKNKKPLIVPWHVPSCLIGQDYPDYKDVGGAMFKRFAFYNFENQVSDDKIDTSLRNKIIENELSSILYKSVLYYHEFIKTCNKPFENIRPNYFNENGMTFVNDNNSLHEFLNSPESVDKYGRKYVLEYGRDNSIELNKLMNKYKNWCNYTGSQYEKKFDISTFNQMGLKIVSKRICTSCRKDHKTRCCENYSVNRSTKYKMVQGIKYSVYESVLINDDNAVRDDEF